MFQNPLGTFPLSVGEISNHLDNFPLNLSHDLFVSFICRSFNIEYGASHILIQSEQPLYLKCPWSPSGLAPPNVGSHKFLEGVPRSNHASCLVKCTCAWSKFFHITGVPGRQADNPYFVSAVRETRKWGKVSVGGFGIKPFVYQK
jgi:hypothetical protein